MSALTKMADARYAEITGRYASLRIAVLGDFCLDRYLEIDPLRKEISIETDLEVFNVVNVRSQPGGAGTILNNLAALGIGELWPIGFAGIDGEGFELRRALEAAPSVNLDGFVETEARRTFTYTKPLVCEPGMPPRELNRLDFKNWMRTPASVENLIIDRLQGLAGKLDALVVLDQVDVLDTGVVTAAVRAAIAEVTRTRPQLVVMADSRRGLKDFPPATFKMNRNELASLMDAAPTLSWDETVSAAAELAQRNRRPVFVTLSDQGILGIDPGGEIQHVPALKVRGPIDIVGAGDAVTANLTAAQAAGATVAEALLIANAAASIVIHQLGTTGTATVSEIAEWVR